jgi:uncharacterized membrane protein
MLNFLLKICLVCIVLDLPVIFFNMALGAFIMVIAIAGLSFSIWKAWRLMRTDSDAFKALSKSEKELSLKDLPARLIILLVAVVVISYLGSFGLFHFDPLIDATLSILAILLLVYYFFQKRRVQKKIEILCTHTKTSRLPFSRGHKKREFGDNCVNKGKGCQLFLYRSRPRFRIVKCCIRGVP